MVRKRKIAVRCFVVGIWLSVASFCADSETIPIPNSAFDLVDSARAFPEHWFPETGGEADAVVALDEADSPGGRHSIRITNRSPLKAFVFAAFRSEPVSVSPETTYAVHFRAKGQKAKSCFANIALSGNGDHRLYLPTGDFDWREFACSFATPAGCASVTLRFACDDVTEGFWVQDVHLERSARQFANLVEKRDPNDAAPPPVFPRTRGPLPEHLVVYDCSHDSDEVRRLVAALQGLVNRRSPRIYLLNPTNPPGYDEVWLRYMQEKGYTGAEERVAAWQELLFRFRDEIEGIIVYDENPPGAVNAAFMLAGLRNGLPATPELAEASRLPVLMDLRGRWQRSVNAYRFVRDTYWDHMSHRVLSWIYPISGNACARDYMVAFNVFSFWVSSYADAEPGSEPFEEEAFLNELLADTPGNVPVMGWPMHGDHKGIPEYTGVRWLSEYGKFVPGTEFCTNLTIHSAIHPDENAIRWQRPPNAAPPELQRDRVYLSVNILDSGDALWYWQLYQRKIWADATRGSVPIGWSMNVALSDTQPLVLQWYCEHATPNDSFFAAISGLGYMNTPVYASRFRAEDRERIWREYVEQTDRYCQRIGLDGVELYNGGWSEHTPPSPDTFQRFTRGMKHLDYILADLGRHECTGPETANELVDGTAVFHTLTRFQAWSSSAEVIRDDMAKANDWLLQEITTNTPKTRPGFMSAMAISWYYYPAWIKDLKEKLPSQYVLVSPPDLARLFRQVKSEK